MPNEETRLLFNPAIPFHGDAMLMQTMMGSASPYEFTDWRNETMAWKETAYLGAVLNPSPTFKLRGPDALTFLADHCVNSFAEFAIGRAKHGIMCNEDGLLMMDGVIARTGQEEFVTYWMSPYIDYLLLKGNYNAIGENITGKVFLYQVAGPKSLEILEAASDQNLHGIQFVRLATTKIAGHDVRILRLGMAGTLAYEVHGDISSAHDVYNAIWAAGKPLGMRKLGSHAYMMNHTEDGFPQAYYHFPYAWTEDPGFFAFVSRVGAAPGGISPNTIFEGSMDPIPKLLYRSPIDLGWGSVIRFDHGFVGRTALEKLVANPKRTMVTLEWDKEDIIDVYRSQFEIREPYKHMDAQNDFFPMTFHADKVVDQQGKLIGISSGRSLSQHYRTMISLCSLDVPYAEMRREVTVVWGKPGTRQKRIRAVVSRFPYLNENRNENIDVSRIPTP
jgi:glycine cleavage system aminomethyltransferase T